MKVKLLVAACLATLALPLAAQAQESPGGVPGGAAHGFNEGNRIAGPLGAVVGGAVGGVVGGVVGNQVGNGRGRNQSFLHKLGNQRGRQNDDVGRHAPAQLVGHGADRTEFAADIEAGLRLELFLEASDQALGRAAA